MSGSDTPMRNELNTVKCKRCSASPRLMHKILNPRTGGTLRMYRCECGEQMWLDEPAG